VAIQLREIAFIAKSFPIVGRAMLTEEPINGVINEVRVATSKAGFLKASSLILIDSFTKNMSPLFQ